MLPTCDGKPTSGIIWLRLHEPRCLLVLHLQSSRSQRAKGHSSIASIPMNAPWRAIQTTAGCA